MRYPVILTEVLVVFLLPSYCRGISSPPVPFSVHLFIAFAIKGRIVLDLQLSFIASYKSLDLFFSSKMTFYNFGSKLYKMF